jgi:hypothetical protein
MLVLQKQEKNKKKFLISFSLFNDSPQTISDEITLFFERLIISKPVFCSSIKNYKNSKLKKKKKFFCFIKNLNFLIFFLISQAIIRQTRSSFFFITMKFAQYKKKKCKKINKKPIKDFNQCETF